MSKILILLAVILISFNIGVAEVNNYNPALAIYDYYYILQPENNVVVPYFANLFALDLLKKGCDITIIEDYIYWYLNHLNHSDIYNVSGSMYDYLIMANGKEIPLYRYDSIDSYAATFLILIYDYYLASGDATIIKDNRDKLKRIGNVILSVVDSDGLTNALPGYDGKYLMDNCEVYGGVTAYICLAEEFFLENEEVFWAAKDSLEIAISDHLFDERGGKFYWGKSGDKRETTNWRKFYPDAYAQLFPLLFEMPVKNSAIKKQIWAQFHRHHGQTLDNLSIEQKIIYDWTAEKMNK